MSVNTNVSVPDRTLATMRESMTRRARGAAENTAVAHLGGQWRHPVPTGRELSWAPVLVRKTTSTARGRLETCHTGPAKALAERARLRSAIAHLEGTRNRQILTEGAHEFANALSEHRAVKQ